jgi:hypothetical protein
LFAFGCIGAQQASSALAQEVELTGGEKLAQSLKAAAQAEADQYNIRYGPVRVQVGAKVLVGYTDNVFYTETNRSSDYLINPEASLSLFTQLSQLNTLKLSVRLGYEYYAQNTVLNSDAPLVNPGSELVFNLFVGDFYLRLHERASYQESLFFNSFTGGNEPFFNFNNVGVFERFNNHAGVDGTWTMHQAVITAGYDHENFISPTASFEYLDRASEWFTASAGYFLGDHVQAGAEGRFSIHRYDEQTVLNNNQRAGVGPFVDLQLPQKITLRAGGGYDTARYDQNVFGSNTNTFYAYGRLRQDTKYFSHWLEGGRELLLGENANNMQANYVRYNISSPIVAHVDIRAHFAFNSAEESGGAGGFDEKFKYYAAGLALGFELVKHWRTEVGYQFALKDSELPLRDYRRNQVTWNLNWTF